MATRYPWLLKSMISPLTIADQHTRFLLSCHGLLSTQTVTAKPVFERAFREYGLPKAIRTDNGVPFATQAIHGLSYLNVWWDASWNSASAHLAWTT
jgi:putative transposase